MIRISLISLYTLGSRFGVSSLSSLQVIAHAPGRSDSLLTLPHVLPHIIVPRVRCGLNTLFILRTAGTLKVTRFVRLESLAPWAWFDEMAASWPVFAGYELTSFSACSAMVMGSLL